ncbi:hypothetical protein O181_048106, partial [Austropuccinia psidii MF-1]|nr:hypothetical protein [Austropuccinia psidii MF-1]
MVKEINGQDESMKLFSATAYIGSDSPRNFREAIKVENSTAWRSAMDDELASLAKMKVWDERLEKQANQ